MDKNDLPQVIQACYTGTVIPNTYTAFEPTNVLRGSFVNDIFNMQVKEEKMSKRRLVKVIIVDPNENIPLDKAVLVNENEKFTDLEDQELFFELDIKDILSNHNMYRVTCVDKKVSKNKDVDVFLEPARIRDLKMVVLTIAEF